LRDVIEAGASLSAATDLPTLRLTALDAFSSLAGCDLASYNEVGPGRPPLVIAGPGRELEAWEVELMETLIHQNPILDHFIRTGDGRARRFSDLLGTRELRRLDLYRELYSRLGVNFQLAISTAAPSGMVVGIALSRAALDFAEAEVAAVELLRPHLVAAHQRLSEIDWLRRMLVALDEEPGGPAVVLADADGRVLRANAAAAALLGDDGPGRRLPDPLRDRLKAVLAGVAPRPTTIAFEHLGLTLQARISPGEGGEPSVVSLGMSLPQAARLASLRLGLTQREAELLAHLIGGGTSKELAAQLAISARTVDKHLENAYRKLGVAGRGEAINAVLAASPDAALGG
jgi:DNA-binding CsgD family transcriptional regulator/PAS domain-containing protein